MNKPKKVSKKSESYVILERFKKGTFHPEDVLIAAKYFYDNGQDFALLPAIEACKKVTDIQNLVLDDEDLEFKKHGQYVPSWLLKAFEDFLVELLRSGHLSGLVSKQSALVEFRHCQIDLKRFEAVTEARASNPTISQERAIEIAQKKLIGTLAGNAGEEAFKKSLTRVKNRFNDELSMVLNLPISNQALEKVLK